MRIGIDVSQMAHEGTGVARYTKNLLKNLIKIDKKNQYVLFGVSLRKRKYLKELTHYYRTTVCGNCVIRVYPVPPLLMEFLWNRLHVLPVEWLIGKVDVFFSSDWLQPPTKAKKVTTLHDLIVFKYPESFGKKGGHDVVKNQKRRLRWVKKECDLIICDSQATKKDAMAILKVPASKLKVIYPGGK